MVKVQRSSAWVSLVWFLYFCQAAQWQVLTLALLTNLYDWLEVFGLFPVYIEERERSTLATWILLIAYSTVAHAVRPCTPQGILSYRYKDLVQLNKGPEKHQKTVSCRTFSFCAPVDHMSCEPWLAIVQWLTMAGQKTCLLTRNMWIVWIWKRDNGKSQPTSNMHVHLNWGSCVELFPWNCSL